MDIKAVTKALADIKKTVDEKLEDEAIIAVVEEALDEAVAEAVEEAVAKTVDERLEGIEAALEGKVSAEQLAEIKAALEALEAKLDAIPAPEVITDKGRNMDVHNLFVKNLKTKGKAEADLVIKNITASTNVTGAPSDYFGLTGSMFASNPFRELASTIETNSKALVLPVRTGAHGAAAAHATTKALTASGNTAAVTEVNVMVKTIEALAEVTIEAADDIIGFDNFWTQDMLDEVASIEAVAHVTVVEGMAGIETDAAGVVDFDDLAALHFSVAPQYRANGAFVVSTDVMKTLRTLNTSSTGGDLIFDAQIGAFRLFGQPIYENAYMANIEEGEVVAAFGDFKKGMVIANRASATVGRYEQTKPGYYTYHAAIRSGAAQWHAPAVKTLTVKETT